MSLDMLTFSLSDVTIWYTIEWSRDPQVLLHLRGDIWSLWCSRTLSFYDANLKDLHEVGIRIIMKLFDLFEIIRIKH